MANLISGRAAEYCAIVPHRDRTVPAGRGNSCHRGTCRRHAARRPLRPHPGFRRGAARDGSFGPNGIRHFEQSLAAVATAPLDTAAKLDLLAIIDDYVFGHVLRAGELQARTATADPARTAAITGYIHGQLAAGQFPHLTKLTRDPAVQAITDPGQLDQRFERGLRALLDGAIAD